MLSSPGFTVFEGRTVPDINAGKLMYFAASIFWRGAAHDWVLMRQRPTRLSLGPYEESLRQFLLDGPFPENASLIVSVTNSMSRMPNMLLVFPYLKSRDAGYRQYRFTIPGITFQLFLGKSMPFALKRLAIQAPERHILMTSDVDNLNMSDAAKLISRTRKVGALAKEDGIKKRRP